MAKYRDVATDADILRIAEAVRLVTRSNGEMTIPQIPERLLDIKIASMTAKSLDLAFDLSVEIATIDIENDEMGHLILVVPTSNEGINVIQEVNADRQLSYDELTGVVSMTYESTRDETVDVIVIDLLLSADSPVSGVVLAETKTPLDAPIVIQLEDGELPVVGRDDRLYITTADGFAYRWTGTGYQPVADFPSSTMYEATIPAAGWQAEGDLFANAVAIEGIVMSDTPIIAFDLSTVVPNGWKTARENIALIGYAEVTATNEITFYASAAPIQDIIVLVKVVR